MTKIFAILYKPTNEFISFKGKVAWCSTGALKNAFKLHMRFYIEEEDVYEIVNLTEDYYRLKGLEE